MNKSNANIQKFMIEGNINRMFITDNITDLKDRFAFALKNLEKIYTYNHTRLLSNKTSKGENDIWILILELTNTLKVNT